MEDWDTLDDLRKQSSSILSTIFCMKSKYKRLAAAGLKVDINQCHSFKREIVKAIDNLESIHYAVLRTYGKEVNIEEKTEKHSCTLADFTELDSKIDSLMNKVEFSFKVFDVEDKLTDLETVMNTRPHATLIEDVKDIDVLLEQFSSMRLDDRESRQQVSKLRVRLMEIKAESEKRNNEQAVALSSISHSARGSDKSSTSDTPAKSNMKIPKLSLPTFDGDRTNWPLFWDQFTVAVGNHPELSDQEKLAYLRMAMKDPTSKEIVSPITSPVDGYTTIVKLLKEAYEDPTKIFYDHLHKLSQVKGFRLNHDDMIKMKSAIERNVRGLEHTGQLDAHRILTAMIVKEMEPDVHLEWCRYIDGNKGIPTYDQLSSFMSKMIATYSSKSDSRHTISSPRQTAHSSKNKPYKAIIHVTDTSAKCQLCEKQVHPLYFCTVFKQSPEGQKLSLAKKVGACTNCLNFGHKHVECKSTHRCHQCNGKHHSMLHRPDKPATASPHPTPPADTTAQEVSAYTAVHKDRNSEAPLLMTAQIVLVSRQGKRVKVRALLDSGASASLVSSRVVHQLGTTKTHRDTNITGIQGDNPIRSRFIAPLQAEMKNTNKLFNITAVVVDKITQTIPSATLQGTENWEVRKRLDLADPQFYQSGPIDLLLGMDILNSVFLHGAGAPGEPKAYQSVFGWVIAGDYQSHPSNQVNVFHVQCETEENLDELLQKFWMVEEAPDSTTPPVSQIDERVLSEFDSTVYQTETGRYCIRLPRKPDTELGDSKHMALNRFFTTEKTLHRKGSWNAFQDAICEYVKSDQAELIPESELSTSKDIFYLPTHAVYKPSSTSTKIRVVFDGSAASSNGKSLNDVLYPGPNIYPKIPDLLLRFREYKFGMCADITKMFLQILLDNDDIDLHRFIFRCDPHSPAQEYRMLRLTFGITSAPFLATSVLRRLAKDYSHLFPSAAQVVMNDFYVDDVLTGKNDLQEAIALRAELNQLLNHGKFVLRKWRTNSDALLDTIPEDLQEKEKSTGLCLPSDHHKTLGVHWDTDADVLYIATPKAASTEVVTKRVIASYVAKIYDVLGIFAPCILYAKCLLQALWKAKLSWDEPVPVDIYRDWCKLVEDTHLLSEHPIARCHHHKDKTVISEQIHGFADASTKGYAAVLYKRVLYEDTSTSTTLIMAKTKVASLKTETIPRLELAAATLLAKLLAHIRGILNLQDSQLYAWMDSQIVLAWISNSNLKLKVYEANRVRKIHSALPTTLWRYVPTQCNPADCASRGMLPSTLLQHQLWWEGPQWLSLSPTEWPNSYLNNTVITATPDALCFVATPLEDLTERFSSLLHLQRVYAWIYRFLNRCRKRKTVYSDTLQPHELKHVLTVFCSLSQQRYLSAEISALRKECTIQVSSSLRMLAPELNDQGLLVVGGRLRKSHLCSTSRHPVILHHKARLSKLIVMDAHQTLLHGGPQQIQSLVARNFHILSCRRLARDVYRQCIVCRTQSAKPKQQIMGQLPSARTTLEHPFTHTGLDYAGPIQIKMGYTRKPVLLKAYVCVFVSYSVKAVHLELVSDLTSEAFIAALRRFISRRGKPLVLHSDHGSNFVGANKMLRDLHAQLEDGVFSSTITDFCSSLGIRWEFIPEHSPNFGGLWEAAVKSLKKHFYACTKNSTLNFEEATTLLAQVEAVLNSRPLTPISSDDSCLEALTPGHFLIGQPLLALPDNSYQDMKIRRRWNLVQQLKHDFAMRWQKEYLHLLNRFTKWQKKEKNLKIGDLVILKEDKIFGCHWPLARVCAVYPAEDGTIRIVDIRTSKGIYRRPTSKLVPLLDDKSAETTPKDVPSRGSMSEPP